MDTLNRTTCKSCPAEIIFVGTANNALMPLNAEPDPAGNIRISPGPIPTADIIEQDELFTPDPDIRYMPHWATCPHPENHRQP